LLFIILDYCDFPSLSVLSFVPKAQPYLITYAGSEEKAEEMTACGLSTLSSLLLIELDQLITTEITQHYQKKRCVRNSGHAVITVGLAATCFIVGFMIQSLLNNYTTTEEFDALANSIYGQIQNTCTNIFDFVNGTCTIHQNLPCGQDCATSLRNCSYYDRFLLNCGDHEYLADATCLPQYNVPYTTPLYARMLNCSTSLVSNYTSVCGDARQTNNAKALLNVMGVAILLLNLFSGSALYACSASIGKLTKEDVLDRPFSSFKLANNLENRAVYQSILDSQKQDGMTVAAMKNRLTIFESQYLDKKRADYGPLSKKKPAPEKDLEESIKELLGPSI